MDHFAHMGLKRKAKPVGLHFDLGDGLTVDHCLNGTFSSRTKFLVNLVRWSEKIHQLPARGALMDQSNFYSEVREFVVAEDAAVQDEMMDSHRKNAEKKHPHEPPEQPTSKALGRSNIPRRSSMRRG